MGIIKDLWESSQVARLYSNVDLNTWFSQWKNDHPEYVKTPIPMDTDRYYKKNKRKSRNFDEKYS